jgi:tetratricopeptide (TPR) repeat protein
MTAEGADDARSIITGGTFSGPVLQGGQFTNTTFVTSQSAVPSAAQLPPLVIGFTGRGAELAQVAGLLAPATGAGTVVMSAVAGLAGVGKTTLAIHAAHAARTAGWFRGGVLFIDLHGYDQTPVQPGQALDELLRALSVPAEHIPERTDARAALCRSVLAGISDPILIIADNASSEAQVRPLLPGPGPHRVVITSRDTLAGLSARLLDVTVLDESESVQLLEAALHAARPDDDRITEDQEAATRVARLCAGLPLALQIVAALLKADPTQGTDELADELSEERDRLQNLRYDDGSGGGELSVEAAFELSYKQLPLNAAHVFRMIAVNPGTDVSTESAVVLVDQGFSKVRRSLGRLAKAHMIEAEPGAASRWRMHDLVRLYAQRLSDTYAASDRRDQARNRLFNHFIKKTQAAAFYLVAFSSVPGPHEFTGQDDALTWLDAERSSLVAAVSMAYQIGNHRAAFELSRMLAEYLTWGRYVDEWLATATVCLKAAQSLGDPENEADAMNVLGLAKQAVRRFDEAVKLHKSAAAISRQTGHIPAEGVSQHNLGMALQELRLWDEAAAAYQRDLAICRMLHDLPGEAKTLNSLALCLQEAGQLDKGIESGKSAAAIFQAIGDRRGEGMALTNVANGLKLIGQLDAARTAGRAALSLLQETGDRFNVTNALVSLGGILHEIGDYDEGINVCQRAVTIYREVGDLHGEGAALSNLASNLAAKRHFDDALDIYQACLNIFRKANDWHMEGGTLTNIGITLHQTQRLDEAINAHREAVLIFGQNAEKHDEGRALKELGVVLAMKGELNEAITTLQRASTLLHETGDRRNEGTVLYNLGFALQEVQRDDEAISSLETAGVIFREIDDQPAEGRALILLTFLLSNTKKHDQAIAAGERATAIYRRLDNREGEAAALTNLSLALREAGKLEEATAARQDAIAIYSDTGTSEV